MRVAGIMSGTSLDGIDVAIIDIGRKVKTVAVATTPYPEALRARIVAVTNTRCETAQISRLNFELGEVYARAVVNACRKSGVPLESVQLVGCHGQTIYHEGAGKGRNTLQIGEGDVIAERLGIPVVSDFRTRDMAAGGQGAPLVPFLDYLLFRSPDIDRVSLNIGGIGNITILPAGCAPEQVTAFDTGPGNMVMDQLVERLTGGKKRFDKGGTLAAMGHIDRALLDSLLDAPYYKAKPPKSAGREQYGADFVDRLIATGQPIENLIATATAFTAATIALAVRRFSPEAKEIVAAGGGVHNPTLLGQLAAFLPGVQLGTTADFGIDPDAKEAIAFAVMAHQTWLRKPSNIASATGAARLVVQGKVSY